MNEGRYELADRASRARALADVLRSDAADLDVLAERWESLTTAPTPARAHPEDSDAPLKSAGAESDLGNIGEMTDVGQLYATAATALVDLAEAARELPDCGDPLGFAVHSQDVIDTAVRRFGEIIRATAFDFTKKPIDAGDVTRVLEDEHVGRDLLEDLESADWVPNRPDEVAAALSLLASEVQGLRLRLRTLS